MVLLKTPNYFAQNRLVPYT